jgi:hypothetical protein
VGGVGLDFETLWTKRFRHGRDGRVTIEVLKPLAAAFIRIYSVVNAANPTRGIGRELRFPRQGVSISIKEVFNARR